MDRVERNGLGLALIGHVALFGALSLSLLKPPKLPVIENEPVEVELVTKIAEQTTAPDPQPTPPAPAPAKAEEPAPPEPKPLQKVEPLPPPPKPAPPVPKPAPKPEPKPVPKPQPKPAPKPLPKPAPAKPAPPKATPKPQPAKPTPARPTPRNPTQAKPARDVAPTGNIRGILDGRTSEGTGAKPTPKPGVSPKPNPPAAKPGPSAAELAAIKRALGTEIGRQLKPRWKAPTGVEVDQLVTILSWDLNADGTLSGAPRFVSQSGVTPSNQAQAALHRDNAIRAVRAAAPFTLPQEHYALWKSVISFRFDKRLSQ